jgi:2-amino-4-hydroxy-6-hydroxymethyldihydropteridine diphosphokinase
MPFKEKLDVILGLGSNLQDRAENIRDAVDRLGKIKGMSVRKISSLYESAPVDYEDQPDFLNAAVLIKTNLKPEELLVATQKIETEMGRVRTIDKGPRNIDIDILLYGIIEVRLPDLKVPHPGLRTRAFALLPLIEVAPDALLPTGDPVRWLLQDMDISGIKGRVPLAHHNNYLGTK